MEPLNETDLKIMLGDRDILIAQLLKEITKLRTLIPKESGDDRA